MPKNPVDANYFTQYLLGLQGNSNYFQLVNICKTLQTQNRQPIQQVAMQVWKTPQYQNLISPLTEQYKTQQKANTTSRYTGMNPQTTMDPANSDYAIAFANAVTQSLSNPLNFTSLKRRNKNSKIL